MDDEVERHLGNSSAIALRYSQIESAGNSPWLTSLLTFEAHAGSADSSAVAALRSAARAVIFGLRRLITGL